MGCKELFDKIDELNEKYISVWEDVCNIESPTAYKAGVDAVGDYFIKMAVERDWSVEVMEHETAGNAVLITMNSDVKKEPVTFSGHIDTVHPLGLFGSPAVTVDDEKIYGPGVMDCKGGVVASFLAMDALYQCGFKERPIQLILQSDEETSSKTSSKKTVEFMCKKAENSIAFFNAEGFTGDNVVLVRKGIVRFKFKVHGRAVHAAVCYTGSNAVAEAAHKLLKLEQMKDKDGLTCNCGVIQGGTVANAVAAECWFLADIRFKDAEEYKKVLQIVNEVANTCTIDGCTCDLEQISYRSAMPFSDKNVALLDKMNEIYKANGLPILGWQPSGGGSDAAYITEIGVPCVDSIGVAGGEIHSKNEFAYLKSLSEAAKRLASFTYCI